jgi:epoxyqueuosine reductase
MPTSTPDSIREAIRSEARRLGFDAMRFAPATLPQVAAEHLRAFLAEGRHGDMDWLARNADRRADPQALWPDARTIVMLGANYGPPSEAASDPRRGVVSVYARGDDYHDVLKGKLKALAGFIAAHYAADVKVFVDTAPVMEKPLAEAAGLGWQGKHTNLVSRDFGSWLFLGSVFTTLDLPADAPETDHCGQCRRCLDACPTEAFTAPYRIDARRCISYLTIEHKGHIAEELRPAIGNRIYGCDDCLAVCPWNKFASAAREARFHAHDALKAPALADLACLDDAAFRSLFRGSPIKRTGRNRFVRNVLIAIGNSSDRRLACEAERLLADASPLVRAMAVWALKRLLEPEEFGRLKATLAVDESDTDVQQDWGREAPNASAPRAA